MRVRRFRARVCGDAGPMRNKRSKEEEGEEEEEEGGPYIFA